MCSDKSYESDRSDTGSSGDNDKNRMKTTTPDESPNNLIHNNKKNKSIYSYYSCDYETDSQKEYERHCVLNHPNKAAYPSLADIEKDGLKPQGEPWE